MKKLTGLLILIVSVSSVLLAQIPTDGLVAYYPFNGNANDESNFGNDGIVFGAALTEDRFGNSNKAYLFDGVDDYIFCDSANGILGHKEITISVWVNYFGHPTYESDVVLSTLESNESGGYQIHFNDGISILKFVYRDGFLPARYTNTNTLLELNTWYHFVAKLEYVDSVLTGFVYLNGILDNTVIQNDTVAYNLTENLRIGVTYNLELERYFKGKIDDIRIYNRALSDFEIQSLYIEDDSTVIDPLSVTITDSNNISCNGAMDGSAIASIIGGVEPYNVMWDDDANTTSVAVINLAPDHWYHVVVMDANLQTVTDSIMLSEPEPLELNNKEYSPKLCAGSREGFIHYNIAGGTMPHNVIWNTGDTVSDLNGLESGKYYITVTDANGCMAEDSTMIDSITTYQDAEICMVTVTRDNMIMIVWEKTYDQGIAEYNIYREKSRDQFIKIKTVPFDSLPVYVDESSLPDEFPHYYKISITDSCGNESDLSPYHKSIHLQTGMGLTNEVNLGWDEYEGFEYYDYEIYRGSSLLSFEKTRTISSSAHTWTDKSPPVGDVYYRIMVVKPEPCYPTSFKSEEYNAPFSNYDEETVVGIDAIQENGLIIYPNPFQEQTTITFPNPNRAEYVLTITDLSGQIVKEVKCWGEQVQLFREGLSPVIYIIKISGDNIFRGKLIIN